MRPQPPDRAETVDGDNSYRPSAAFVSQQAASLIVGALAARICTPQSAPVIAATRLRGDSAHTACGAASFAAEAITTPRAAGCTGIVVARMDSGYDNACFPVTARLDPAVKAAIAAIGEDAWTPVKYPRAIWDDQLPAWVPDAEVAYPAFASGKGQAVTARLIVRRVKDLSPRAAGGQGELFVVWRYHPVLTDYPLTLIQAGNSTVTMPGSSRSSRTGQTGPWHACPQAGSPLTPPGSPWPASRTT